MMTVEKQLENIFGLKNPVCRNLNTLANYAVEVTTPSGCFALKLYNPASRTVGDVQWELDLTRHLIENGAPVAKPITGPDGHPATLILNGQERVAVLFEWAAGAKPNAESSTYVLLGKAAARIHQAADTFTSSLPRERYDVSTLIDEQLTRMKTPLVSSGQWQRVLDFNRTPASNHHRSGTRLGVFAIWT